MAKVTKPAPGPSKFEADASKSLHRDFQRKCKKLKTSMAQRIRDLIAADVKLPAEVWKPVAG